MSTISFARGVPAPECLPSELLADCAAEALRRDGSTILSYGPSPGYAPLREQLAERHGVDPSRIFLTNGSLQGFVFLAQRLAPGKRVLVERPTYDRPLKILRELGADVVGLQCDDEGLDPDALADALRAGERPAFLYLIPTFQNPSGRTLSSERRLRIVERARGLIGARRDVMVAAIDRELPDVRITRPDGGYFLWAELGGVDAGELLTRAEAAGVTFVKGTDFDGGPDTLRLAYSFVSLEQ